MTEEYQDPDPDATDYYTRLGVPITASPTDIEEHADKDRAEIQTKDDDIIIQWEEAYEVLTNEDSYEEYRTFVQEFDDVESATTVYEDWVNNNKPRSPEAYIQMLTDEDEAETEQPDPTPDQSGGRGREAGRGEAGGRGRRSGRGEAGSQQEETESTGDAPEPARDGEPGNPNHPASAATMEHRDTESTPVEGAVGPPPESRLTPYLFDTRDFVLDTVPENIADRAVALPIPSRLVPRLFGSTDRIRLSYWLLFPTFFVTSLLATVGLATGGAGGLGGGLRALFGLAGAVVVGRVVVEDADTLDHPLAAAAGVVCVAAGVGVLYAAVIGSVLALPIVAATSGNFGLLADTLVGGVGQTVSSAILFGLVSGANGFLRLQ